MVYSFFLHWRRILLRLYYFSFNKIQEYVRDIPKPRGTPNPERPPLKKRATLRRALSRQASKKAAEEIIAPRKPPKKQNTIRNLAKQSKFNNQTPKQRPKNTNTATATNTPRKPPKKQNTIRNLARTATVSFQVQHDDGKNGSSRWRKPPKKQSTIRRHYTKQKTATRLVQNAIKKSKLESKISSIKRKRQNEDQGGDRPFKRCRTENKKESSKFVEQSAKPVGMKRNVSGVKKRKDPRITHAKAYHAKKSPKVKQQPEPISTPTERRGKIALGIANQPALKRVRTRGKASNQVTLPAVEDRTPPMLSRRLSGRNSKQTALGSTDSVQPFVQPKIPLLKKGGSLRRQVLKKGLARQDTLELNSSTLGAGVKAENAATIMR